MMRSVVLLLFIFTVASSQVVAVTDLRNEKDAATFAVEPTLVDDEYTQMYKEYTTPYITKMMGEEMKKHIPIQMDDITLLTQVDTKNQTLSYTKQLDMSDENLLALWNKEKESLIQSQLQVDSEIVCAPSNIRYLVIYRDMVIEFKYINKNDVLLFSHVIAKEDCLKIKIN